MSFVVSEVTSGSFALFWLNKRRHVSGGVYSRTNETLQGCRWKNPNVSRACAALPPPQHDLTPQQRHIKLSHPTCRHPAAAASQLEQEQEGGAGTRSRGVGGWEQGQEEL